MAKVIDGFTVKTMSKSQLAAAYGISIDTLKNWIDRLKKADAEKLGTTEKLLTPAQVTILIEVWGAP